MASPPAGVSARPARLCSSPASCATGSPFLTAAQAHLLDAHGTLFVRQPRRLLGLFQRLGQAAQPVNQAQLQRLVKNGGDGHRVGQGCTEGGLVMFTAPGSSDPTEHHRQAKQLGSSAKSQPQRLAPHLLPGPDSALGHLGHLLGRQAPTLLHTLQVKEQTTRMFARVRSSRDWRPSSKAQAGRALPGQQCPVVATRRR